MEVKRKKCKIVMLPTEDKTNINLYKGKLNKNKIGDFDYRTFGTMLLPGPLIEKSTPQHLYITSDDEIKEGDCMYDTSENTTYKNIGQGVSGYKIIATTDKSLGLPQPSKAFIEKYCKVGGINEVVVDYVEYSDSQVFHFMPFVNTNNEIIIHPVKDNYSKEEVERLCRLSFGSGVKAGRSNSIGLQDFENIWINQNL